MPNASAVTRLWCIRRRVELAQEAEEQVFILLGLEGLGGHGDGSKFVQ